MSTMVEPGETKVKTVVERGKTGFQVQEKESKEQQFVEAC